MKTAIRRAIEKHALQVYTESRREACGLIVAVGDKPRFVPCQNSAENAQDFRISGAEYARCEDIGQVLAVVHSHVDIQPLPSESDKVSCEASGLPWHIVAVGQDAGESEPRVMGWHSFEPSGYRAPLVGRSFHHGDLDCYGLARDFYAWELGIELPDFDRPDWWWEQPDGGELYLEHFEECGFVRVDGPMQYGDGILMQYRSERVNHAGVYLGEHTLHTQPGLHDIPNAMLHHAMPRLSERVVYAGYWRDITRMVVRHRSLM